MIEVRIPKEITEYKEKVIFGLSIRQLIFFTLTIILSIGSYFIMTKKLGLTMDSASYVIIFQSLPLLAVGFIRINGFPFEKYALLVIRHKLGIQKRPYKTSLLVDKVELKEEKEIQKGGKGKYAWIFEKGEKADKRTRSKNIREANLFIVTKKDRKRKRKATLQQIKTARKEYRKAKQRKKKDLKKTSSTQNSPRNNEI